MEDSENSSISGDEAPATNNLIDNAAEEENDTKDVENSQTEEAKNEEIDENNYERDGFVVSDGDASDASESDNESQKKVRKRKRLKRRAPALDDDDLQLIKDNLNEEAEFSYENENKRPKPVENDGSSIDSDGMDEFIVDSNVGRRRKKHRDKFSNKVTAEMEFAEEQNQEFMNLFGYDKADYEVSEEKVNDDSREKSQGAIRKSLRDNFQQSELAKNYLLEEDLKIISFDVPERIQLKERELGLIRNKVNRGEFFLRFNLSQINNKHELEESLDAQRLKQASWVFNKLEKYRQHEGESALDFENVSAKLLCILKSLQVECLEPGFLFLYRMNDVNGFTFNDLLKIQELGYEYAQFMQKRDKLLKLIETVVPDDFPDDLESVVVTLKSVNDDNFQGKLDDMVYGGTPILSTLKLDDETLSSKFYPSNLVPLSADFVLPNENLRHGLTKVVTEFDINLEISDLSRLHKSVILKFGSKKTEEVVVEQTKEKADDENSLFGDDSDDEVIQPKVIGSSVRKITRRRGVVYHEIFSKSFEALLKCVAHVPFVSKRLLLKTSESTTEVSMSANIPQDVIKNPYKLCARVIAEDKERNFSLELKTLYQKVFGFIMQDLVLSVGFNKYLSIVINSLGKLSTKPGSRFSLLLPDFSHRYIKVSCIDQKPLKYFREKYFDSDAGKEFDFRGDFLLILKAEKENMVDVDINEGEIVSKVIDDLKSCIFSESALVFIREKTEAKEEVNVLTLEDNGFLWDSLRLRFLLQLKTFLKKFIKKKIRSDLKRSAESHVQRSLENSVYKSFCKDSPQLPFSDLLVGASKLLPSDWVIQPKSKELRILSLYISDARYDFEALKVKNYERFDIGAALIVNGKGDILLKEDLPSLIEMDKLKTRIMSIIEQAGPHFVIYNPSHGPKSKHLFYTFQQWSLDSSERVPDNAKGDRYCTHNPHKIFVPTIPDYRVAAAWAQAEYIKRKANTGRNDFNLSELKALSAARFYLDPMLETAKLLENINETSSQNNENINPLASIILHPLQGELPLSKVVAAFRNCLMKYVVTNGVNMSDVVTNSANYSAILQFLPGFGPRKAARFLSELKSFSSTLKSRLQLKHLILSNLSTTKPKQIKNETEVHDELPRDISFLSSVLGKLEIEDLYQKSKFPSCVYENAIGFMYLGKEVAAEAEDDLDDDYSFNPMDTTRIHPANYKLTGLLAWMVLKKNEPMPKITETKVQLGFAEDDDGQLEENFESTQTEDDDLDRDDVVFPKALLNIIGRVFEEVAATVENVQNTEDLSLIETLSQKSFDLFIRTGCVLTNMETIFDSISKGEDNMRFAIENKLEELENDLFKDQDLVEIAKLLSAESNDLSKVIDILFSVQELRFPQLPIKTNFTLSKHKDIFWLFIGEEAESLNVGSLVNGTITEFSFKGIQLRLQNGFRSLVHLSEIPNKKRVEIVQNDYRLSKEEQLEDYCRKELNLHLNDAVSCWIKSFDIEKFSFDCTMIEDVALQSLRLEDPFAEKEMINETVFGNNIDSSTNEVSNTLRRITHPDFFNLTQEQFSYKMESLSFGEYFFKPSSKGFQFLSLYWKVICNKYNNHVVEELDKEDNNPELGKRLRIGTREFEDLDDIVANFISPVNEYLTELKNYSKHFRDISLSKAESLCAEEKKKNSKMIPYFIIPDGKIATFFHFVFQPARTVHKVSFAVKAEGFVLDKNQTCKDLKSLLKTLKEVISKSLKASAASSRRPATTSRRYDDYPNSYRSQGGYRSHDRNRVHNYSSHRR